MAHRTEKSLPNLFDEYEPRVVLAPAQMTELEKLVEVLLLEIVAALTSGEVGDDQNNV